MEPCWTLHFLIVHYWYIYYYIHRFSKLTNSNSLLYLGVILGGYNHISCKKWVFLSSSSICTLASIPRIILKRARCVFFINEKAVNICSCHLPQDFIFVKIPIILRKCPLYFSWLLIFIEYYPVLFLYIWKWIFDYFFIFSVMLSQFHVSGINTTW